MKFWNGTAASFAVLALSAAAFAQGTGGGTGTGTGTGGTTTAPATCTTVPTGLSTLNVERVIMLNNVLTTLTPNAPASLLAAISGGAMEIREQLAFTPGIGTGNVGTVTSTIFLVAAGSPNPTPAQTQIVQQIAQTTTFMITDVLASCSPTPSLLLVGRVTGTAPGALLGGGSGMPLFALTGAPVAISIGYTTDNPAKINNIAVVVAGQVIEYSAAATGTLTVTTPSGGNNGGGGMGTGPMAIITLNGTALIPTNIYQVSQSPLQLSASTSTGTGLTYSWSASGNAPVAFDVTNQGTTTIQFPAPGDYVITLTVTDASGATNSASITIEYTGRPK